MVCCAFIRSCRTPLQLQLWKHQVNTCATHMAVLREMFLSAKQQCESVPLRWKQIYRGEQCVDCHASLTEKRCSSIGSPLRRVLKVQRQQCHPVPRWFQIAKGPWQLDFLGSTDVALLEANTELCHRRGRPGNQWCRRRPHGSSRWKLRKHGTPK